MYKLVELVERTQPMQGVVPIGLEEVVGEVHNVLRVVVEVRSVLQAEVEGRGELALEQVEVHAVLPMVEVVGY